MCGILDIRKHPYILCKNRGCLAKRSWALLASNSTRDSQVRAGRMCRLLRSLGAHSFCPECLENASVCLDPPTDSLEEPNLSAISGRPARTGPPFPLQVGPRAETDSAYA